MAYIICPLRYKKLWDQDKDAYIRRYEKAQKPLSSYEADVTEYMNKEVRHWHVCIGDRAVDWKALILQCVPVSWHRAVSCGNVRTSIAFCVADSPRMLPMTSAG